MLSVSNKQISVFRSSLEDRFVHALLGHAAEFFPNHLRLMEKEDLERLARYAISAGRKHGFATERSVYLLFGNMLLLGSHFMEDPLYPWVRDIMAAYRGRPAHCIEAITQRADADFELIGGPRQVNINRAFRHLIDNDQEILKQLQECDAAGFTAIYQAFFPAKFEVVGNEVFASAMRAGILRAATFGLDQHSSAFPFVFVSFIAGSGFDSDPQFPWASPILQQSGLKPQERSARIFEKAVSLLRNFMSGIPAENDY